MRRLACGMVLIAMLLVPVDVFAADITVADLEAARERRAAVAAELSDTVAAYDEALDAANRLELRVRDLTSQITAGEQALEQLRADGRTVVRDIYMSERSAQFSAIFESATFEDVPVAAGYLDLVSDQTDAVLSRLEAAEASHAAQLESLEQSLDRQREVVAIAEDLAERMLQRLGEADAEYRSLVAAYEAQEAERQRLEAERLAEQRRLEAERLAAAAAATTTTAPSSTAATTTTSAPPPATTTTLPPPPTTVAPSTTTTTAAPPPPPPSMVCPVDGAATWYDDWLAPRSGGRLHQGIDMIAVRGTPLVAIESGTIDRVGTTSSLGGLTIWLNGISGAQWYYAHLDSHAAGLAPGTAVAVGEVIGTVGNTGNAQYTVPHLHFEYHPGGGPAARPHGLIAELCG